MMSEYQLLVDTWESGGEIDEAVYKANDIAGILVRLNDMNGGHHMDTGFVKQWAEAENFLRAPYFVYNPWKNAQGNFDWLISHCPEDAHTVLIDIEVKKLLYPKSTYAAQVSSFMNMVEDEWGTKTIYTGAWFLDMLDFWPNCDYWWAQYPYALYPSSKKYMSWDEVRKIIDDNGYTKPFNYNSIPGTYRMWQISGDKVVCPGNDKPIDINLFPGTKEELALFLGYSEIVPEPPPPPTPDPGSELEIKFQSEYQITFIQTDAPAHTPDYDPLDELEIVDTYLYTNRDLEPGRANHTPLYRTPDKGESKKIYLLMKEGEAVKISRRIPKYRRVLEYDDAGNLVDIRLVENWDTEADRLNIEQEFACVINQPLLLSNNHNVQFPRGFEPPGNYWDFGYLPIEYLRPITSEEPPPEPPPPPPDLALPHPWDLQIVPDEGEFIFLLHDFETSEWGFLPRSHYDNLDYRKDPPSNALPSMVHTLGCRPGDFLALGRHMQWLWVAMLVDASGGVLSFVDGKPVVTGGYKTWEEIKAIWLYTTANHHCLTDAHSANENGYDDLITGLSVNDKEPENIHRGPLMQKCLSASGNICKVKYFKDNGNAVVYAVNPLSIPTLEDMKNKPWFWHWLTQSTVIELRPGIYRQSPHPNIKINGVKTGTPFMFIGANGENEIEAHRFVRIENGEIYSPYIRN